MSMHPFMIYVGGPLATREEADRLVEMINEKAALAAEYVDLIGYDPFEDCAGETVESVRQRLAEYKKAVAEDAEGAA